jgi:hypothetical protein
MIDFYQLGKLSNVGESDNLPATPFLIRPNSQLRIRAIRKAETNFAGPGRQPGYFLCKAPKKVTKEMA